MTQIWPNPPASKANKTSDTNSGTSRPQDILRIHLARAQIMISAGMFALAFLALRWGTDAVADTDYYKFSNAYELAMLALNGSVLFMLAICCLAGWIMATSGVLHPNSGIKITISPFTKNGSSQLMHLVLFLLSMGASLTGLSVLWWLRSEKLIPRGMHSAGLDLFSVTMAVCCFVYAVVQIRQASRLISQGKGD